jgi:hypothetical protein
MSTDRMLRLARRARSNTPCPMFDSLYGIMVALLLYYKKFLKSLKSKGFKLNPNDPCVANKQVNGEQLTM